MSAGSRKLRGHPDRQAERLGAEMDRARPGLLAASGRPRRLGVDGEDLVAGGDQRVEGRDREVGRAHEDDPHGPLPDRRDQARAISFFSFFIFDVIIVRFTGLR